MNDFLMRQIRSELEDAVGQENVSVRQSDKISHSVDNFWLPRMYADRGLIPPLADIIVSVSYTHLTLPTKRIV